MIKAIIVDDEPNCCKTLSLLLDRYCPDVQVTGIFHNGLEGLQAINSLSPDLVFLDVQMPKMNGFEMLKNWATLISISSLQQAMINML